MVLNFIIRERPFQICNHCIDVMLYRGITVEDVRRCLLYGYPVHDLQAQPYNRIKFVHAENKSLAVIFTPPGYNPSATVVTAFREERNSFPMRPSFTIGSHTCCCDRKRYRDMIIEKGIYPNEVKDCVANGKREILRHTRSFRTEDLFVQLEEEDFFGIKGWFELVYVTRSQDPDSLFVFMPITG
jgi:hypothetical protein